MPGIKKVIKDKKNKISLEDEVMGKIRSGEVKMKPRWYFVLGSFMSILGLVGLSIGAAFLFNIIFFLIRKRGPGVIRLEMMFSTFPWWIIVLAFVSVVVGVLFLRQYDFSYKKNFWFVVFAFVSSILLAAWAIDYFGINDSWSKSGPMKRFYQQMEKGSFDKPFNQNCRGRRCR